MSRTGLREFQFADCYQLLDSGRLDRLNLPISLRDKETTVREQMGYEMAPCLRLGVDEDTFLARVFPRFADPIREGEGHPDFTATAKYEYLVIITLHYPYQHYVFVEDLPHLLPFLASLAAIASAHMQSEEIGLARFKEEEMEAESSGE